LKELGAWMHMENPEYGTNPVLKMVPSHSNREPMHMAPPGKALSSQLLMRLRN
jgi:hypothetical protein